MAFPPFASSRWASPLVVVAALVSAACTDSAGPDSTGGAGVGGVGGSGATGGAPSSGAGTMGAAGSPGAGTTGVAGAATSSGGVGAGSGGMTAASGAAGMSSAGSAGNSIAGTTGAAGGVGASGATGAGGASGGVGGSAGASGGQAGAPGGAAGAGGVAPMDATCGAPSDATGVAEKYAGCFPIGAAVDSGSYTSHSALLKAHFNSVTAENEMKFASLEPNEGSFTYSTADAIVNFATTNKMKIRGHTLVWHSQNPSWLFSGASKDTLLARMKKHISNVVGHFKGKVYAWDVVNEAIMEDGSYRDGNEADDKKSQWYSIIGESYIAEAFKAAHEADPDAKLFYNDFYDYIPAKQQGIYDMLKGLLDAGVPVHGVGMQCHLNIQASTDASNQAFYQDVSHLEDAIKLYSSLGLDVQVTELDLSLYVPGITYTSDMFYTPATFTDELKAKQAARYKEFFELFRRYRSVITGVTFWGIADDNTWLSEFSSGRQDFPLLFDVNHNPKPAYDSVIDF